MKEYSVYLNQVNFTNGTVILDDKYYIITNPKTFKTEKYTINLPPGYKLVYKLKENIVFKPNINNLIPLIDQGIPSKEQFESCGGYYNDMAYGIGFFAAVVITGQGFIFDLNNCKLEQSFHHSIRQRFFALIELANSPFLPKTGPRDFIDTINSAHDVVVKNGTLGLSSHHGIHGNNNFNVKIEGLKFEDFEVAAIALNGGSHNIIENVNILHNNHNIPVIGLWSAALFLYPYIKHLYYNYPDFKLIIGDEIHISKDLYNKYLYEIENTIRTLNRKKHTKNPLFNNHKKLIDGPFYGILLNPTGVAVNGFPSNNSLSSNGNNIVRNIKISKLKGFNNEIPSLFKKATMETTNKYLNNSIQNDVVGSVLQTQNYYIDEDGNKINLTIDEDGIYKGNIVSNIQLLVAKAINNGLSFGYLPINVNSITKETIHWAENKIQLKNTNLYYIFQGDSMHHVIKGGIALRLDCLHNSIIENIQINNVINVTEHKRILYNDLVGVTEEDIQHEFKDIYNNYKNGISPSHNSATYPENQSSVIRGISLCNSHKNTINNVDIKYINSLKGDVILIDYHDKIRDIER